ncbi:MULTISPECIES: TetR/AcrR family transcriptional regulator [Zobellia]|uniref:TetR-type transcriptional regulator n=1 Tax=Zobellia galactanivorans (strain DSM 12802 / CCUG 47099 / CIP 106680 / NCIMB 13871 / Dsij) TaxID=63186 RepID=G0L920_ZOBGA|nr:MULTISPECIES: TetR/AcrR family transcriptional regulator [Zobellia]MBU3028451.1 TetR/AcrR family transcriptional regulator [Zobellia galactanivorans]OWW24670.1 TetR family transcriptional regulator [Zobellia sp. OII3]CAZ94308.1 TetR-type transcriptional regulator [Zobellia galactanivorans]
MRPQKILDKDLMVALAKVFRAKGYEGTSLAELAEVTGLKKASLYHRFPKGKEAMGSSVFNYIGDWVQANVFAALADESNTPEVRLKKGLKHIGTFYDGGRESCIFRAFSMETGLHLFEKNIESGMNEWISAFTKIGVALKQSPESAKANAVQTLIEIQGSLIVTKGLNDTDVFEKTLQNIENRYLNK